MATENDNLESKQILRLVDLLCEGEIEGFPSARAYSRGTTEYNRALLKDIYFDNTPIVQGNANPSQPYQEQDYNYKNVQISTRYGTADQTYLTELSEPNEQETSQEIAVNQQLVGWIYAGGPIDGPPPAPGIPLTRSITDPNVEEVRVTINVPQLQNFHNNGDIRGYHILIKIEVAYGGGAYTTVIDDSIGGRTVDLYQRSYLIPLTNATRPATIRVTKNRYDSAFIEDKYTVSGNAFWASYTEITRTKTKYPYSALVGMRIDSESVNNIPQRSYRIRGLKVKVPSNATVDATKGFLVYNGVWDGTFSATKKWTTCPVWILYDLLTSSRYGFGTQVTEAQLDTASFYAASAYANTLVPDGNGGQEPRFACNVNIQTQEEAYKLINDLCSVFRAMPYWSVGQIEFAQDRPTDPGYIFNQSNVTEEGFTYSGSSLKTRHTVVGVKYFDMDARDHAYEVVEDAALIDKYGMVKTEIEAFACTSRGQARRVGRWMLYEEANTTEVVTFTTGIAAGQYVRPGTVIQVMDPVRAGRVRGGRVRSAASAKSITLDRSADQLFTDAVPSSFRFNVMLPDGSYQGIEGATINGNLVTLPTALNAIPTTGAPWVIGITTLSSQLFRVVSVQEQEGDQYVITGVKYDYSKYDYIERDTPLAPRDITDLNEPPAAPSGLTASELLYESNGQVLSKVLVSWASQQNITQFVFRYRLGDGNWTTVFTKSPDYEILNSEVGRYSFELQAEYSVLNTSVKRSGTATATFDALGKTAPPTTIPDLFIAPIDERTAELYWPQAVDLDVRIGGQIRIRHTPEIGANATWGRANDITPAVSGSSTRKIVPLLEGTYIIRAVDSTGNESAGVASVVVDLPAPQDSYLVQEYREEDDSPPFQGSKTNMFYSSDEGGLVLTATGLIDDITDWDSVSNIDFYGDTSPTGSYQFLSTLDLSQVYDIDLLAILKTRAFQPGSLWDDRVEYIDEWDDIDGDDLSAVNAALYVRTTNDNPSGTPTWGSWQPYVNGTTRGRGFQFKVEATSHNPVQNLVISELGVTTKLQRRTEQQRGLSSGATAYSITFPSAFYATPSVGITAQDMATGDYFTLSSVSRTGFTVTFRNSGGSMISRSFDYQAVGHGRQIT